MRKWLPLVTVSLGTFMLLVDVTIVNVALPNMAKGLSTSFTSLQWVIDGYALALAALVLGAGSVADLVGHRRAYIGGLAVFAAASFVCGIAPNADLLIAARFAQGVGGAAMFATTFALLNSSYTGRDRGTAYGIWGAVAGASASIGPILGGVITEGLNWRWIFFVNLPVSAIAIAMCVWLLAPDVLRSGVRIDIAGMLAFTAAAGLITYALIRANEHSWMSFGTLGSLAAGAVLLAGFVVLENRSSHAMLDMGLLRNRAFVGVLIAALFLNFAAFANFTYVSIWLQSVVGQSPIKAGLAGLPLSLAAFVVSASVGRFLHSRNPAPVIGGGLLLVGTGALLTTVVLRNGSGSTSLIAGYLIVGVGVGLALPTLSSAGMSAVPVHRGGMASGAVNTARQLGFAFGIALLGSVFAARAQHTFSSGHTAGAAGLAHSLAGGQAPAILAKVPAGQREALLQLLHTASISGIRGVFLVSGVIAVVAGLAVLVLMRPGPAAAIVQTDQPATVAAH